MNITIVTTERKLTVALLKQMPRSDIFTLIHGTCLGYIASSVMKKYIHPVLLFEHNGVYSVTSCHWTTNMNYIKCPTWDRRAHYKIKLKSVVRAHGYARLCKEHYKKATQIYV